MSDLTDELASLRYAIEADMSASTARLGAIEAVLKLHRDAGRTCGFPACGGVHKARGWCSAHYRQWQRRGRSAEGMHPVAGRRVSLAVRVEDAVELLDQGVDPEEVAARLDTNVVALEHLCRRHGHPRRELFRAARRVGASRRAA